ncbi:hypothetical protein [Shewanella livingstonensis]|uniref:Uncharacterized protein n=1 Tax=Shewanella livingstonensis TaxID=150120 RepID=A0A3G8M0A6_9GAMM|nr:hypothetical protein [Shewanella livingstonensis]AZG75044.1 hypothetical protein EGC82_21155 [Shewanella livingstonensis]
MTKDAKKVELASIHRSMIIVAIIDFPGTLLFGLGLYGVFAGFDDSFLPMLAHPMVINAMLVIGGSAMAWGMFRMVNLARQKQGLVQQ